MNPSEQPLPPVVLQRIKGPAVAPQGISMPDGSGDKVGYQGLHYEIVKAYGKLELAPTGVIMMYGIRNLATGNIEGFAIPLSAAIDGMMEMDAKLDAVLSQGSVSPN